MKKINRHKARETAFLFLFQHKFSGYDYEEILELDKTNMQEDADYFGFVKDIFFGVLINKDIINEKIQQFSIKWNKERLSKVAKTILEIAIYEMLFRDDIPLKVSVNEAIEFAKKYGQKEESAFINGILSGVFKELQK